MDSFTIHNIATLNKNTAKLFKGIFAHDAIPKNLKLADKNFIICNLCNAGIVSEFCHWILIYKKGIYINYFDPTGYPTHLLSKFIVKFLKRHKCSLKINVFKFQSCDSSIYCGQYCLIFIYLIIQNVSSEKIIVLFKNKTCKIKDLLCMKLFKRMYTIKNA